MCNMLRLEGKKALIGKQIEVMGLGSALGKTFSPIWRGHCREDSLRAGKWSQYRPIYGLTRADHYTEKGALHTVPEGMGIAVVMAEVPWAGWKRGAFIVTREVTEREVQEAIEQGVQPHHRHPLFVPLRKALL